MLSFALASVRNVLADRKGVTALEYGVIAGGIVIAIAAGVGLMGDGVAGMFAKIVPSVTK